VDIGCLSDLFVNESPGGAQVRRLTTCAAAFAALLLGCASAKPIVTVGDFLEQLCEEDNAKACATLAAGYDQRTDAESLKRAKAAKDKACKFGDRESCVSTP
jgi:hypothetical protein